MSEAPRKAVADGLPVVWAGRFADHIVSAGLPNECLILGERNMLAQKSAGALNHANVLVVLDLLSLPLADRADDYRDIPMVVVLPSDLEAGDLTAAFGPTLFERLGFFDRFVTSDSTLWEKLRHEYRWADSQRLPVLGDDPGEVAAAVCNLLESESIPPNLRSSKLVHTTQAAAIEPYLSAPRGRRHAKVPLDVLEIGCGAGRWASSFDPKKARFVGTDSRANLVQSARANFPDYRFDHLGADLQLPYDRESFDVVFSVTAMQSNPEAAKRSLLSEMWRVARAGGRLLFLEDFVVTGQSASTSTHPISVTEFMDLLLDATVGQVVLEYVESLRYPGEDLSRGGLVSLLRLGVPKVR
jgi:SAM-dependent methyltransferase